MTKSVNNIFCERLKALRKSEGMSQTELGDKLHLSRTAVSYYEKGERIPNTDIIQRIAGYFNCSSDYLMGSAQTPSSDPYIKAAVERMGLSEKAVEALTNPEVFSKEKKAILNLLIEAESENLVKDNFEVRNGEIVDSQEVKSILNSKYPPILALLITCIAPKTLNKLEKIIDTHSDEEKDMLLLLRLHKMIIEFRQNFAESNQKSMMHTQGGK